MIQSQQRVEYKFVGGSHDGNILGFPAPPFKIGFAMGIDARTSTGHLKGKKEVYKLEEDGQFHYQKASLSE